MDEAVGFGVADFTERRFAWFSKELRVVQPLLTGENSDAGP
jgi:hypothetical protein